MFRDVHTGDKTTKKITEMIITAVRVVVSGGQMGECTARMFVMFCVWGIVILGVSL